MQKIGIAKDVNKRLKQLQTGNPLELKIHYYIEVPDDKALLYERKIHLDQSFRRMKGEWFKMDKDFAIDYMKFVAISWLSSD